MYQSKVELRTDVKRKMDRRRRYRRTEGTEKQDTEGRDLTTGTEGKGWLPPSLESKANSMVKIAKQVSELLPINDATVEIAPFDMQKLRILISKGKNIRKVSLKDTLQLENMSLPR